MHGLEKRRLALEVLAHARLHARHVVRVHEVVPVEQHVLVVLVVTEHLLPAPRQVDALGQPVEIPDAVVRGHRNQLVALAQLAEDFLVAKPLEPRGKRCAHELDEQVHVGVPARGAVFVGERQETGDFAVDRKTDDQGGPDMQLGQTPEFVLRRRGRRRRVVDFNDLEVPEPADQPRPVLEALPAQDLGRALRESCLAGEHRFEVTAVLGNQREKRGIAAAGIGQLGDIGLQQVVAAGGVEILQIDGDLGLQRVDGAASAFSGTRSTVPDSRCGRGVGRVRHG